MVDVGIVVGGGKSVLAEYDTARFICDLYGKSYTNFVVNDMIESLPDVIDNAVTLHPSKLTIWLPNRERNGFPMPGRVWSHRPSYHGGPHTAVTNWTKDWGGSSGLFAAKIARENGLRKIILCGVPMTVEDLHFKRNVRWNAAHGFRRAWVREAHGLAPFIRSFSGWTAEQFGVPTREWLDSESPDPKPVPRPYHMGQQA